MLQSLLQGSLEDAKKRETLVSFEELLEKCERMTAPLDAKEFLSPSSHVKVIAEIKRASPSRGQMAAIEDPVALATEYAAGGASMISVLTEERKFKGSLNDLASVRKNVNVPLLRKDFIGNKYQIAEARVYGADVILLIVAALDTQTLKELYSFTRQLGMQALIETHDAAEIKVANELGAELIGVNARDLKTFELHKDLFGKLSHLIPETSIKIAESAVLTKQDVEHYRLAGADVVLVGEALATASDPKSLLKDFLSVS